ncbi:MULTISPECIES: hypothetical protein [unclassified Roseivivax]|uniref:hypothetical protein n=1 Tax=unclassified Roseivivax TaxID=2639302 RepID=UPI0012682682|nr:MULTISPECIES: hypothetical protein [unclassified Roseivivax]
MNQQIFDKLDSLLEEEHRALLKGDFESIGDLLKEKQRILDMIGLDEDAAYLDAPIIYKLRRNLTLYDEALAGLRAVAQRIGNSSKTRAELRIYGKDGHTTSFVTEARKALERRA